MKPDAIYNLVQELKRRRVFRGILVYGASTLILLEAAGNIANVFGLDSAPPWFVWLLGIGFLFYKVIDGAKEKKIDLIEKSIAVLPFHGENLSHNEVGNYEVVGAEITSCLTKIQDYDLKSEKELVDYQNAIEEKHKSSLKNITEIIRKVELYSLTKGFFAFR